MVSIDTSTRAGTPASRRARILCSIAAVLACCGCLQVDPPGDQGPGDSDPLPEDPGRRAGASSSTNWPPELVGPGDAAHQVLWRADSVLRLTFRDMPASVAIPAYAVPRAGTLRLFPGSGIPSLDSARCLQREFPSGEEWIIPLQWLDSLSQGKGDTVLFNLQIETDTLQGWLSGFRYSSSSRSIASSGNSPVPATTSLLSRPKYYFKGSSAWVASLLPASTGSNPRLSFYIPGTPIFATAQVDSFEVGPIPSGVYPLRILRISERGSPAPVTLVEAWELLVTGNGNASVYRLGEKVLDLQSRGSLGFLGD